MGALERVQAQDEGSCAEHAALHRRPSRPPSIGEGDSPVQAHEEATRAAVMAAAGGGAAAAADSETAQTGAGSSSSMESPASSSIDSPHPGTSPAAAAMPARTRSSSVSSDGTQRAPAGRQPSDARSVRMPSGSDASSSASSLDSLTPLASPASPSRFACTSASTAGNSCDTINAASASLAAQQHREQGPGSAGVSLANVQSAPAVILHQRHHQHERHQHPPHAHQHHQHHHHHAYSTSPVSPHCEQRRRSGSGSSAHLHAVAAAASTGRRIQYDHSSAHDAPLGPSCWPSDSAASPPPLDAVNTLGLCHDHTRQDAQRRQLQQPQHRLDARDRACSLVAVTSSNPIRPHALSSHAVARTEDSATVERLAHGRRHQQQAAQSGNGVLERQEERRAPLNGQATPPLSMLTAHSSLTDQAPEQAHLAGQRKNLPINHHSTSKSAEQLDESGPSYPWASSSARPDLPYRIPSLTAPESFTAALPESLAKLVIIDSPPASSAALPGPADFSAQQEAGLAPTELPADIVDSPTSASPEGNATPAHTHGHGHPEHAAFPRLSSSLPASPTQATHTALSEALASSRYLTSFHTPSLRRSLDLSCPSAFAGRLPLTPLEETNTPDMRLDSPADLAELSNPFDALALLQHQSKASDASLQDGPNKSRGDTNDANETFYHTLLELVQSESRYTSDLTDLVEVHFSLLSIARFVTEEQRTIIVRDATRLVELHHRLQEKLNRVDADLGWIREDDERRGSHEVSLSSPCDTVDSGWSTSAGRSSPSPPTLASPTRERLLESNERTSGSPRNKASTRRFKISDATVLDAARRISAIFINESKNLSEAYQPFCSGHSEAMEVVKDISGTVTKADWDAFEVQCTAHLAQRKKSISRLDSASSSSRLHFADFLIKPVQRICRYPLLFGSLLKNAQKTSLGKASHHQHKAAASMSTMGAPSDVNMSIERIREALHTAKAVASAVDHAQKLRSLEVATVKIARRIEVQSSDHVSLLNRLDQVVLVGSAHVIYTHAPTIAMQGPPSVLKAGFYGLVLYASYLVFFKVKKTNVYEPRHWLPLQLFDLQKVQDGEGTLPYAFRMSCRDHTFEIGSLCHAEQNIWIRGIEEVTLACRRKWLDAVANKSIALDENPVCSVPLDSTAGIFEGVSPIVASSEFGVFPTTPEASMPSISRAGSVLSSSAEEAHPPAIPGYRARLSLKPPAQRVGVDLRLADLLSESILSARAQSKRSHAMPLHGPPPRTMTASNVMPHTMHKRPHSFHTGSFSYRHIIDSTIPLRRTSLAESDGSKSSSSGMKQLFSTSASSANLAALPTGEVSDNMRRKPRGLRRSRTSTQVSDQEATDATTKPQRSNSTLGKIRRRAASLVVSDNEPMKGLEEIAVQDQQQQTAAAKAIVTVTTQSASLEGANAAEQAILDAGVQATVARNSSTSSSSSYASTSTDPSLGNSLDTPQSSLPASPLLTPVDLETHSRWTKIGDALSHTLMRKRSFASQRPILSIPPEAALQGAQLEQAQNAAEFIYTGRNACGSNCSHESGAPSAATSSHSYDRRYSWDKVGWNTLTSPSGQAPRMSFQGHQRSTSGLSAPPSMSGTSQPNLFGGRSAPNLTSMMADKRQSSSGSLWSVFERDGDYHSTSRGSSSPAPSIYEDAPESNSEASSAYPSPAAHVVSLPDIAEGGGTARGGETRVREISGTVRVIPMTRMNPLGDATSASHPAASAVTGTSTAGTSLSPATPSMTPSDDEALAPRLPARTGSQLKRKNSLSARLRAFRSLGSGMTPVRQQQPSRTYLSR